MNLRDYFENVKGIGVLATADTKGKVNVAVYARPHFLDPAEDKLVAFIMNERLSYANIQANPNAAYVFTEEGEGYAGKRLVLTKIAEEDDPEKIASLRRRKLPDECDNDKVRHLVHFRVDGIRPLIGNE